MKKVLFLALPLMFATAIFAQQAKFVEISSEFMAAEFVNVEPVLPPNTSSVVAPVAPFWTNNFDTPTDWVLDNSGQNPPDYGWSIDPNSDGWWSNNGINSTSGGNFAELSNGNAQTGTQVGGVIYTMTTALPINIFDSIGSGNATLSFEEYGARFYDLQEVQVSTDGVTFTTVGDNLGYTMLTNNSGNVAYPNPTLREINIAPYIGNTPTTVWLRFSWTSALNLAVTDQYYYNTWITYGWYIDDVQIAESPANRITMEDEVIGGFWIDYLNYTGSGLNYMVGLDYSVTPLSQLQNHPYAIEAVLRNEGTASQDVALNYDVTGPSSSSGSSNPTTLAPGDSTIHSATFAPSIVGPYSIDIYGTADSAGAGMTITTTDVVSKDIEVTNYIYGKDLGGSNPGSYVLGGPVDQNHITTRYEMYANESLTGLKAFIHGNSIVGAQVKAIIYELDTTAASGGVVFLDESDNYTITAQDLGAWIDIPFLSPISLFNGYAYEFGIAGFQHPADSSFIGVSGSMMHAGEHSSFDELGLSTQSAGTPTWYYISSTPMVRMNFDPGLINAVSDVRPSQFNVYPNPTNGVFTIELDGNVKYDVTISNVLGQTVYTTSITSMNTTIDLSSFEKGIYTIELKNNSGTYTEKVIVEQIKLLNE